VVALSATNVNDPDGFVGEIAINAIKCLNFAKHMSGQLEGGFNVQTH
jgi:hypothetical protein